MVNQKLRYIINEHDNNIKFIKATFEETSLLVQRKIIPTNNIVDKPQKIRQFSNYVAIDKQFISYLTMLMNMVQNGGETLKMVSIIFTCFGDTKKELDNIRTILIAEMTKKVLFQMN